MNNPEMLATYDAVNCGDIVKEYMTDGFPIRLYQHATRKHGSFSVQYGKQLWRGINYEDAAARLGEALMHDLSCQSLVDNERD